MSGVFSARYRGNCEICELWWDEGDLICYDEDDNLVHAECWFPPRRDPEPPQFNLAEAMRKR